jgi:hypothetical protein
MADKEYIERNALIAEYDRIHIGPAGGARKLMVDAPAADVVEAVRCEKCKYYGDEDKHVSGGSCKWHGSLVERTDFCSYGERKKR